MVATRRDKLIEAGVFRRVLFVPLAFGGSFITDWIPGGAMNRRMALALSRLHKTLVTPVLPVSAILWQQGEAEANHTTMSSLAYQMHFHDIVADLRANGIFAPVMVAQATLCDAEPHPCYNRSAIREAQSALANPSGGILAGPDVDKVGPEERFDRCHFSQAGLAHCAQLWFEVLSPRHHLLAKL